MDLITPAIAAIASASATAVYYRAIVKRHEICPVYHILTRTALELRWNRVKCQKGLAIAFADIDNLKLANESYGYDGANERLSKALSVLRKRDLFAGRFFSGDEFVIVAPAKDIHKPVDRLVVALRENGLSATIAIAHYNGEDTLTDAVAQTSDTVKTLKSHGIRGIIFNQIEERIC